MKIEQMLMVTNIRYIIVEILMIDINKHARNAINNYIQKLILVQIDRRKIAKKIEYFDQIMKGDRTAFNITIHM